MAASDCLCSGFNTSASGLPVPTTIATGNWGCGVFDGDVALKSLIQLLACSESEKVMRYYPWDVCHSTVSCLCSGLHWLKSTIATTASPNIVLPQVARICDVVPFGIPLFLTPVGRKSADSTTSHGSSDARERSHCRY